MIDYLCDGNPSALVNMDTWSLYEVMIRLEAELVKQKKREKLAKDGAKRSN